MTRKQQRNIIAATGTFLFMGLVILLLWLLSLTAYKPFEQDFVEMELLPPEEIEQEEEEVKPITHKPVQAVVEDPGVAKPVQSTATDEPTQTSAEQVVSEEEILAIRQQQIADSIAEAQQKAKDKVNSVYAGITFTAETEEQNTSAAQPPVPGNGKTHKGSGSDGDNKWSLDGRGLVGSLPKPEGKDFEDGDIVVLGIEVDANGNVIGDPVQEAGTYATSSAIKMAKEAAKKAKFTKGDQIKQKGTIIYKFKVN